jgi:hypothetical protein
MRKVAETMTFNTKKLIQKRPLRGKKHHITYIILSLGKTVHKSGKTVHKSGKYIRA